MQCINSCDYYVVISFLATFCSVKASLDPSAQCDDSPSLLALQEVEEVKRGLHGIINPALCVILRAGSGGQGVPPLASPDGGLLGLRRISVGRVVKCERRV